MKITLSYTPEKNLERGIRIETGETAEIYMDITAGQTEYEMPDRNIFAVYAYVPVAVKSDGEVEAVKDAVDAEPVEAAVIEESL